eukprot:5141129-Pyramimonas_sp.AAC.1
MGELGMVTDYKKKLACWDEDGACFPLRQQSAKGHFVINMLESYDGSMKERADQTLLPHNISEHVRVQDPTSPCTILGDE